MEIVRIKLNIAIRSIGDSHWFVFVFCLFLFAIWVGLQLFLGCDYRKNVEAGNGSTRSSATPQIRNRKPYYPLHFNIQLFLLLFPHRSLL